MSVPPSVAALVVTYNSTALLDDFVASLEDGFAGVGDWELVVADNASSDDSVERLHSLAPDATVVRLADNRGYAAGVNAAAAATDADALFVLNPDVRLSEGTVAALAAGFDRGRVVAPRVVGPTGAHEPSLRRETSVSRVFGEAVLGGNRAGRHDRLGEMITDPTFYDAPRIVDWASGCALLIDRSWFEQLGGFDESFFHGSEETDFCLRTADSGGAVAYEPDAVVRHLGGDGAVSEHLRPVMFANRLELYRRRHGPCRTAGVRLGLLLNEALRAPRHAAHRATFRRLLRPGHPSRV